MQPFRTARGAAAPLPLDDVNTDQIIPSAWLKDLTADLADGFLAYMRRLPDGSRKSDFVLEQPQFHRAPILVTGGNFGCGSSREHAVWAMRAFGVRCVIGANPAETFHDNCVKNGILSVALMQREAQLLMSCAMETDGREPFSVDLESREIFGPAGFRLTFDIAEADRAALLQGLDDIGLTLKSLPLIEAWERQTAREHPFAQSISRAS